MLKRIASVLQSHEVTSELEALLPALHRQQNGGVGGRHLLLRLPHPRQPKNAGGNGGGDSNNSDTLGMALLVPVRAAMHGSFPLAGTYFQVPVVDLR